MTSRLRIASSALWILALLAWGCAPAVHDGTTTVDGGTSGTDSTVSGLDSDTAMTTGEDAEDTNGMCGSMGYPCCPGMQCLPGYTCTGGACTMPSTDSGTVMMPDMDGSTVMMPDMDGSTVMMSGMDGSTVMMGMVGPPDVLPMPPVDANPSVCRAPIEGAACSTITQTAMPVAEMRVATAPPPTSAGWYPAGTYQLTSATLYTGPGGASGPSGLSYAVTLQVNGVGSVDYYQILRTQAGCPTSSFRFSGDTAEATTSLSNVGWMCPTCTTCGTTLAFTGTLTSLLLYFPQPDGTTLAELFEYPPTESSGCGTGGLMCCGGMCFPGYTCTSGICQTSTGGADSGTTGETDSMVGMPCGSAGLACCGGISCFPGYTCTSGICHASIGGTDSGTTGGTDSGTTGGGTDVMVGMSCGTSGLACCPGNMCMSGFTCTSGTCR